MQAPAVSTARPTKVAELYGLPTFAPAEWSDAAAAQRCPFLNRKCLKNRKSDPDVSIGTCTMTYGRESSTVMICPFRLLERRQIFHDCTHLLKQHEPGNELRIVTELSVPGGSVDYCLVLEEAEIPMTALCQSLKQHEPQLLATNNGQRLSFT